MSRVVDRYLRDWAEPEVGLVPMVQGAWHRVLAIPACSETDGLLHTLRSLAAVGAGTTLVVVVVNAAQDAPDHFHERNEICLRLLSHNLAPLTALPGGTGFLGRIDGLDVLCLDRASPARRLCEGQGVGLARKIGADLALALVRGGRVEQPWLWMTDADVLAPAGYFDVEASVPPAAAFTVPFTHVLPVDAGQAQAARLYDISLRYYVLGLAAARSPYAYATVGSTVVAHAEAYAKVRGFPRRNAAEDFYLLGKLAKVGGIYRAGGPALKVEARVSDRVPFGTGAAITKLQADEAARRGFALYDPRVFDELAVWLRALDRAGVSGDAVAFRAEVDAASALGPETRAEIGLRLGVQRALSNAARSSGKAEVRVRHLRTWFDAFRTLKFIHALRELAWPSLGWQTALARAPFVPAGGESLQDAHQRVLAADRRLEGVLVGPDA